MCARSVCSTGSHWATSCRSIVILVPTAVPSDMPTVARNMQISARQLLSRTGPRHFSSNQSRTTSMLACLNGQTREAFFIPATWVTWYQAGTTAPDNGNCSRSTTCRCNRPWPIGGHLWTQQSPLCVLLCGPPATTRTRTSTASGTPPTQCYQAPLMKLGMRALRLDPYLTW